MRISDWSSDVCSSDLSTTSTGPTPMSAREADFAADDGVLHADLSDGSRLDGAGIGVEHDQVGQLARLDRALHVLLEAEPRGVAGVAAKRLGGGDPLLGRSEEPTSELQSLMRISYAVF